MFAYGDGFPDFIGGFEPAKGLPYLADVARIEAAWTRAYHAADQEPSGIAWIASLDPAELTGARFEPHPAAAIVVSAFPAGSIWAAHQSETVTPVSKQSGETVLVVRPELDVHVHVLPASDTAFAAALLDGETIGAAAETAFAASPDFDFGKALVGLVSLGAFGGLKS